MPTDAGALPNFLHFTRKALWPLGRYWVVPLSLHCKLQAVLTLRQRAEQSALEKYSRAIENRQSALARVARSEMDLSEARRHWLHALADGCPAVRAAQLGAYCHSLEEGKRQGEQSLNLAEVELNQASQKMLQARQEREAVEIFLSRQSQQHARRLEEEERKLVDDMANRFTVHDLRLTSHRWREGGSGSGGVGEWESGQGRGNDQ